MENKYNTFITLGGLKRFLEDLRLDMKSQSDYVDKRDAEVLANAKAYADLHDDTNLSFLKNYTNAQVASGISTSKEYSNSQDAITLALAKSFANDQDAINLATAKQYTDKSVTAASIAAANDASEKSNVVQGNLNTHIGNVTDAHDMDNRLQALKVAMQSYTDHGISKVVGGAPEMLDTLYELSKAIGNDSNFGASMTDLIGQKLAASEVVTTPTANKVLRLDANAEFPPIVINQDAKNRFFTDDERAKLAAIEDNATNYKHPTTPGYMHIPAGGKVGQILGYQTDGAAQWITAAGVGIGTIMPFLALKPQPGWLAVDSGQLLTRAAYPDLWAWVQSDGPLVSEEEWQSLATKQTSVGAYSTGDGSTTFRAPRILDYVRGGLAGEVGLWQDDMFKNHTHAYSSYKYGIGYQVDSGMGDRIDGGNRYTTTSTGGTETRPKTIKMLYCVKAFDVSINPGIIDITALANSINGITTNLSLATTSANGLMSAMDKLKLDGIEEGANKYIHPANHPASVITQDATNRFVSDDQVAKWDTIENNVKTYTDGKITEVYSKQPVGSAGQVYYIDKDNSSDIKLSQILASGRFVETPAELSAEMAKVISFATIFNSWERFRIGGTVGEENSWIYNPSTDQVSCTQNTAGFIGFISNEKYDNYSHEASLSSNYGDDDLIGLVIAYHKDPITGKVYTLHASRSSFMVSNPAGVIGPAWAIVYNWKQPDQVILYQEDSVLRSGKNWDLSGSTRLRITRNGDIVNCETTAFGNTSNYLDTYKYTIDLSSNPLLSVFRGPKQYGYCVESQINATFSNIVFADITSMIFDIPNNKVYTFKSGSWVIDSSRTIIGEVGAGKLLSNPVTGKLFFIKDKDNILAVTTKIPLANNLTTTATGTALDASQGKILNDSKEPSILAGTANQYWKGNKTWGDFGLDIRGTLLTGLSTSNLPIAATDSLLTASGKLQGQISAHIGSKGISQHGLGDGTTAGFSSNDYTTIEKNKLAGITVGNAADNVPINNGVLNSTLNADMIDGIEGSALMKLDGSTPMTGSLQTNIGNKTDIVHYRDLAAYSNPTNISTIVGTMKVTLPFSWNGIMGQYIIKGYDYTDRGHWELRITGYNYPTTSKWDPRCSVDVIGSAPFTTVRLAHDGTKCCILLGGLDTKWEHPKIVLTDFIAGYAAQAGWQSAGWSIIPITSESGITSIVTPVFRQEVNTANLQDCLNALPNI